MEPRSVFPELAKYTILAFAAQLRVDVLFADMETWFLAVVEIAAVGSWMH